MSTRVDSLIQLMRLSGTDKVRAYLEKRERSGRTQFLYELESMFEQCKRDSVKEAWPTMAENQTQTPCTSALVAAEAAPSTVPSIQTQETPSKT